MRRDRLYLLDIVDACRKIERFIDGKTFEEFVQDEILFDATVRNLQNIGEAVRYLPEETRALRAEVEWTRIVGLRHLLVHQCAFRSIRTPIPIISGHSGEEPLMMPKRPSTLPLIAEEHSREKELDEGMNL